jgi:hypothetical protein
MYRWRPVNHLGVFNSAKRIEIDNGRPDPHASH